MNKKLASVVLSCLLAVSGLAYADCLSDCEKAYEQCVKNNGKNCNIKLDNCAAGCKKIN